MPDDQESSLPDRYHINGLFWVAQKHQDPPQRAGAYRAMWGLWRDIAELYIDKAALDPSPVVRCAAAELLAGANGQLPLARRLLLGMLGDDSDLVRRRAVTSLRALGAADRPLQALGDPIGQSEPPRPVRQGLHDGYSPNASAEERRQLLKELARLPVATLDGQDLENHHSARGQLQEV